VPTFQEQDQELLFPDDWEVLHYDEDNFRTQHLGEHEAVDFVAISPQDQLLLIEVKDFRGYSTSENRTKITSGELSRSIGKKVVATVAGLLAGHFRKHISSYERYAQKLADSSQSIRVLALIEHSFLPNDRARMALLSFTDQLKSRIRWLDQAHAWVGNGDELQNRFGIMVQNLPRSPNLS